jgi:hypothetical protein
VRASAPAACAHTRLSGALSDKAYIGLGLVAFLLALAIQYGLFQRFLRTPLRLRDLEQARPAVGRWLKVVLVWQVVVLVGTGVYIAIQASRHVHGFAWTVPAIGAVIGTALPLQVAVFTLMRSARG